MSKPLKSIIDGIVKDLVGSNLTEYGPPHPPDKNEEEVQSKFFRVSKMEEEMALNFIRNKLIKYPLDMFKSNHRHTWPQRGDSSKLTIEMVRKQLKKVEEERFTGKRKTDELFYEAHLTADYYLRYVIYKDKRDGDLMVAFTHPITKTRKTFYVNDSSEHLYPFYESHVDPEFNKEENKFDISKREEGYAAMFIERYLIPHVVKKFNELREPYLKYRIGGMSLSTKFEKDITDVKSVVRSLKKVREIQKTKLWPSKAIQYVATAPNTPSEVRFTFEIEKTEPHVVVVKYLDPWGIGWQSFDLKPWKMPWKPGSDTFDGLIKEVKHTNPHITKQEEEWALQVMRERSEDKKFRMTLRKVDEKRSTNPHISDALFYTGTYSEGTTTNLKVFKKLDGELYITLLDQDFGDINYKPIPVKINENIEKLNLHINKQEEMWALENIKKREGPEGPIGPHLKKIEHRVSNDPSLSDQIVYFDEKDRYTYTICKNGEGKLGLKAGYPGYTSAAIHLLESTGDWKGWGMVTNVEKERLKIVLEGWIKEIEHDYHPQMASTRVYLVQKCINNFDTTDPRFAAKPLAQLSMEDRLYLMDYVDRKDTTGQSSKVMDLLIDLSRQYIEPPRKRKVDIIIRDICDVQYGTKSGKGDVEISGLEDNRPTISLANYSWYNLDEDFINQFSKPGAILYVDRGQGIKITNMEEVMASVKLHLEDW